MWTSETFEAFLMCIRKLRDGTLSQKLLQGFRPCRLFWGSRGQERGLLSMECLFDCNKIKAGVGWKAGKVFPLWHFPLLQAFNSISQPFTKKLEQMKHSCLQMFFVNVANISACLPIVLSAVRKVLSSCLRARKWNFSRNCEKNLQTK